MSTETKILAIVGSPRIGGNTDVLVNEVLAGAEEKGAALDKVYLSRSAIGPCHACDACEGTGVCFQRDDMDGILQKMEASDIWVLGTPIYWWGATAQFKLFLDRWYGPWHGNEPKKVFQNKKIALVITMGDTDASTAEPTLNMFKRSFDTSASISPPLFSHLVSTVWGMRQQHGISGTSREKKGETFIKN